MSIDKDDVGRFMNLFKSNTRSFGNYMPNAREGKKGNTVKAVYTAEHMRSHLEGEVGLGLVPIQDDDTCWWAAIDIDVHGPNGREVDIFKIEAMVTQLKLPLTVCRSKSGGAHCYLFLKEPLPAERIRMTLNRWATRLGYPGVEIFPKQITLKPSPDPEEGRPLGNWINLPYFDVEQTNRYAIDGGKQVSFDYFLELAETKRTDLKEIDVGGSGDFAHGPPCLQAMLENKVEENRNIAAFQAGVFLKRAYPDDWVVRLKEFNQTAMFKPLAKGELGTISGSLRRKDYQYKCREDPCRAFCNKDLCRTREFGISAGDEKANEIPLIEKVEKVVATPIRWALTVKGQIVEVTTEQLFNYEVVRQKIGEKLHIILPRIKATEWDVYLREIMGKVDVRQETTIEDMIFFRLCEYLKKASKDKSRDEEARREDLRRGQPALVFISDVEIKAGGKMDFSKGKWHYAFKMGEFVEHLRRKKQLPLADHQMWSVLHRILGEESKRDKIRAGANRISNVWMLPEQWVEDEAIPVKRYETEY